MPELPEVETVCQNLSKKVLGKVISQAKLNVDKLRFPINKSITRSLKEANIVNVKRKAKYIVIELSNDNSLVIHLGMSGRLTFGEGSLKEKHKHDHFIINFKDESELRFNDPRRFGMIDLIKTNEINDHKFFRSLGIEPLSKEFKTDYLYSLCKRRSKNIKSLLMDSSLIVGIGNIYASEILYEARVLPTRPSNKLKQRECEAICKSSKKILKKAIKAKGSTLRDYKQLDGEVGSFQKLFEVYARDQEPCNICGKTIQKITQNARSSYYCDKCQN